ncbi:MAG: UUP1 family membrane protein, partial [bacterium]
FLSICGVGITFYKSAYLGFPLIPGQYEDVWTLESKISFKPSAEKVQASLLIPAQEAGWRIVDEHFTSSGYELSIDKQGDEAARAIWLNDQAPGAATLYYKIQTFREASRSLDLPDQPERNKPMISAQQRELMEQIIAEARGDLNAGEPLSTRLIQKILSVPKGNITYLVGNPETSELKTIRDLLALADLPSLRIRGVYLEDGRRRQVLSTLLAVHEGKWRIFDLETGEEGTPDNLFVWQTGDSPILDVIGGTDSRIEFAIVKNSLPLKSVLLDEQLQDEDLVLDYSIYSLPVEQQGIFKTILLMPVGAFVVVLLRILIGLKTSGTFMPILIALALMETTLLTGLVIFLTVIGIGLWIRNYLSHLNLLLVARVAAVVIVVILLMAFLSITSYKMGIDQALTVTFFPTIILSWTIERMSILWEEEGAHEVFIQGGGSLVAAVLAYFAMSNRYVEHLTFNFPELLFSLLGVVVLIGSYTGYRLMEFYRFRQLKDWDQ